MCEIYDKIQQEGIEKGMEQGKKQGILYTLVSLVEKGLLTISQAAEEAKMTVEEFQTQSAVLKQSL